MLTEEQILNNRERFIDLLKLLNQSDRANAHDIEGLINYLDDTQFFLAPATTQYYYSCSGGLCAHSLLVYDILVSLNKSLGCSYKEDSLIIVALLHNLCRIGFYEDSVVNKKVYSPSGNKFDELGKFDWVSTKAYKVKEAKDRITIGSKGFTSFIRASQYIALNNEETVAIVNQSAGMDRTENADDIFAILDKYNLTLLLHSAILFASYLHTGNE